MKQSKGLIFLAVSIFTSFITTIFLYFGWISPIGALAVILALGRLSIIKLNNLEKLYQKIFRPLYSYAVIGFLILLIIRGLSSTTWIQAIPIVVNIVDILGKIEIILVAHIIALSWVLTALDKKFGLIQPEITTQDIPRENIQGLTGIFKYIFLILLLILSISSVTFLKDTYLENIVTLLRANQFWLAFLTVNFGAMTFYIHQDEVIATEAEEEAEDRAEDKRGIQFDKKFSIPAKIPILNNIFKWFYKQGWVYSFAFILIITIFSSIRILSPIIYQTNTPDEFFHMSVAKSLVETGRFAQIYETGLYLRGAIVSVLTAISFYIFGINFYSAKLVPILLGFTNLLLVWKILELLKVNKKFQLIYLLFFTLNPIIIFNHYTLRMYIFYEFAFVSIILLLIYLNKKLELEKYRQSIMIIILIIIINILNYFFMYDTGNNVAPLATIVGFIFIFINRDEYLKFLYTKMRLKFIKTLYNKNFRYLLSLLGTIIIVIFIYDKIISLINKTHFSPTEWDYYNLFFEYFLPFTILAILGILMAFILNKKNEIMIGIIVIILSSLHLISSLEIHHWRAIAYLIPIFLLLAILGINYIFKIHYNKGIKIISIFMITGILISLYSQIVPDNYIKFGPTIPEASFITQNIYAPSLFLKQDKFKDSIILEGLGSYTLSSHYIFDINVKYKINTHQDKTIQNHLQYNEPVFYNSDTGVRPFFMKTEVLNNIDQILEIIRYNDTVFIVSEEMIKTQYLFDKDTFNTIINEYDNVKNFEGVRIYYN